MAGWPPHSFHLNVKWYPCSPRTPIAVSRHMYFILLEASARPGRRGCVVAVGALAWRTPGLLNQKMQPVPFAARTDGAAVFLQEASHSRAVPDSVLVQAAKACWVVSSARFLRGSRIEVLGWMGSMLTQSPQPLFWHLSLSCATFGFSAIPAYHGFA